MGKPANIWDHFEKQGWDRTTIKTRFYAGLYGSPHLEDQQAYDEVLAALQTKPEYLRQLMSQVGRQTNAVLDQSKGDHQNDESMASGDH